MRHVVAFEEGLRGGPDQRAQFIGGALGDPAPEISGVGEADPGERGKRGGRPRRSGEWRSRRGLIRIAWTRARAQRPCALGQCIGAAGALGRCSHAVGGRREARKVRA